MAASGFHGAGMGSSQRVILGTNSPADDSKMERGWGGGEGGTEGVMEGGREGAWSVQRGELRRVMKWG